jgi:hypothetical protein
MNDGQCTLFPEGVESGHFPKKDVGFVFLAPNDMCFQK